MNNATILSLLLFAILKGYSQDYLISFAGSGASPLIDSVKVENLTQNKVITVFNGNQLRLKADYSGINSISDDTKNALLIYPNPAGEYSIIELDVLKDGSVTFDLFDLSGKPVAQMQSYLTCGKHSYNISGLGIGIYTVIVKTENYNFTGKIISHSGNKRDVQIRYIDKSGEYESFGASKLKSTDAEISMQYTTGDRLKLTGVSGDYRTVIIDVPSASKTITFTFESCTDGDNNNYPVVNIGKQTWMAENLKTTTYKDDTAIPLVTDDTAWSELTTSGYCWYNNNEATYKNLYGALYNWYTVNTGNLCPTGWHVPSDDEWTILTNYLEDNGYGYGGIGSYKIAKSMAGTTGWAPDPTAGNVGNDQSGNNSTGFTAFPGGNRRHNGTFLDVYAIWWSSTESSSGFAWHRFMHNSMSFLGIESLNDKFGFSVRCVKD